MDSTPSICTRKFLRMLNKLEHIFDFPHIPSFVTLFSGNQNEPLYFVEVTQKGTTHEDLTESYLFDSVRSDVIYYITRKISERIFV